MVDEVQDDIGMEGDEQADQEKSAATEVKPFGPLDVDAVQVFQPTAPAEFCGPAFPGKLYS